MLSTSCAKPQSEPRLCREFADWHPLLTPVGDYAEEAAFYLGVFEKYGRRPLRNLLDLGSGGGHNAAYFKASLGCTLVDISASMLTINRRLNPECEHIEGDMRSLRLGRVFDVVFAHDAVSYMVDRTDLAGVIETAFLHTAPGGIAVFHPDYVEETFESGTDTGGSDAEGRGLRYLEWRSIPVGAKESYANDMVFMLRDGTGDIEVHHDRHVLGLFSRAVWLTAIAASGFEPRAVPFEHSAYRDTGNEVFLGIKPQGLERSI